MPTNTAPYPAQKSQSKQGVSAVEKRFQHLEIALKNIGGTVIATTEAVDCIAERMDALAIQVQEQNQKIETLNQAVQNIKISQQQSRADLNQLKRIFKNLFKANKKMPKNQK